MPRRDDRRRRPQGRPARRRQRPAELRPRAGPARHAAGPLRPGRRRRHLHLEHRERDPPLLHHARHAGARPGQRRRLRRVGHQDGAGHRRPLRRGAPPVHRARPGPRDRRQRLPRAPAQAAAGAGHLLRAALRAGGAGRHHARRADGGARARPGDRRGRPARARVPRGRPEGRQHLARHPHHPDVPRGLRRRRLPGGEPAAPAQGRHRRLQHLRGRQHGAAAAGRQGPAHRLPRRLRLARRLGEGLVLRRHGARDGPGADGGPRPDRPAGRRRPRPGRGGAAARPRLAAQDVRVPREAHARGRDPAAAAELRDRRHGAVRHVQRRAGPRAAHRPDAHRPDRAGGVRRGHRADHRPRRAGAAGRRCATSTRCTPSRRTRAGSSSTAS